MASESNGLWTFIRVFLFLAFSGAATVCLYLISATTLSEHESGMLGILVAILSVLASWIITDTYAASQYRSAIKEVKEEYRTNLRTYALKAAEKVNNLSNELNKLSVYLEDELSYTDYRSSDEELFAKEERMESAVHLIRTLKSVNDTSLSDWEGVIGDELDEQRAEKEVREQELRTLIERSQAALEDQRQNLVTRHELQSLERELRLATLQLGDVSVLKRIGKKEPKQEVSGQCPNCQERVAYRQRASVRSFKIVLCPKCSARLVSTYGTDSGFELRVRREEGVSVDCPHCKTRADIGLDNFPGGNVQVVCPNCAKPFRVIRTVEGVDVRPVGTASALSPISISEDIIRQVQASLPEQPWPRGTHLLVSQRLAMPTRVVRRAVAELIRRGVFRPQVDGLLHDPLDP